jgi:hypothetical protein
MMRILEALAKGKEPMNQYQLRKKTRLAKDTVKGGASMLKIGKWITIARIERKRGPNPSEFYELTPLGKFRVAASSKIAYLKSQERERLGANTYQQYVARGKTARQLWADRLSTLVREAILAQEATPGWHLKLDILADKDGRIKWEAKIPGPWGVKNNP